MFRFLGLPFGTLLRLFRSHHSLLLENLALRQQLVVLKRRHPRPKLNLFDRLFWLLVRRCWSGWKQALLVVTPETVVRWHRAGFRWYWRMISRVRKPLGRRQTSKELRDLLFQMMAENPSWGAPRIHGELLMLGFDVSERTISRWMKRAPGNPDPAKRWLAFLRNHRRPLPRWISSPFPRLPSPCSTAFLSSATIAAAFCTATLPGIRRACGLFSSCGRRSRLIWRLASSFSIATLNTGWKSRRPFAL